MSGRLTMPAILFFLPLFLYAASAVNTTTTVEAAARDDIAVARLVDRSRSLPPEFKADVIARLAESGALGSSQTASDVLEEAFFAASAAQERVRLDTALPGGTTSREETRSRALTSSTGPGRAIALPT